MAPMIKPVLLPSSSDSASSTTVVAMESTGVDSAVTALSVGAPVSAVAVSVGASSPSSSWGAGVSSASVGASAVTSTLGAGCTGSAAPSTGVSIQSSWPTSQIWTIGKSIGPAAVGAVNVIAKSSGVSAASDPPVNVTTWPSTDAVQPSFSTGWASATPAGIWICSSVVGDSSHPCSTPNDTVFDVAAWTAIGSG